MADDEQKENKEKDESEALDEHEDWLAWAFPGVRPAEDDDIDWPPCPVCGSEQVEAARSALLIILGFIVLGISAFLLIVPPVALIGFIFGAILVIIGWTNVASEGKDPKFLRCENCEHTWKIAPAADDDAGSRPKPTPFPRPSSKPDPEAPVDDPTDDSS